MLNKDNIDKVKETCANLILSGVVILAPENTYIEDTVKIGEGTVIYPNNVIEGNTVIGKNAIIGPNNRIVDCEIGDNANIQFSVLTESKIGEETRVGPFAYLRPNSVIGKGAKIGDFVEVKNSNVGDNTSVAHLTYVGDSDVGEYVNFGCGTAIANYDGNKKHRTTIGDKCFIGCNTNLVAPVSLGNGVYTAAGTTVTKDVPDNALVIGRAKESIIEQWAKGKYKHNT